VEGKKWSRFGCVAGVGLCGCVVGVDCVVVWLGDEQANLHGQG